MFELCRCPNSYGSDCIKGAICEEKKLVGAFEKKLEMFLIRRKLYLR